jgi:hypothetical protein
MNSHITEFTILKIERNCDVVSVLNHTKIQSRERERERERHEIHVLSKHETFVISYA